MTAPVILSDLDGVLVTSSAAVDRVWRRWASAHGLDAGAVLRAGHGRPSADTVREVAPHLDAVAEAARLERAQIEDVEGVRPVPGAAELLAGVPPSRLAIVTSCTAPLADARLRAAGLAAPAVRVTRENVHRGKPDPQGYLLAAARLGADPGNCVVLEDAPAGVAAGRAAGMGVVGVLTGHTAADLDAAHALVEDLRGVDAVACGLLLRRAA